jgi:ADP-ribose pyrophosphatase YjhB (NUDIX family)
VKTIDRFQYVRAGLRGLAAPVSLGVCAIATAPDGRVILVRHTYRAGWYLPGGGVAHGETGEAAIQRELAEEVGLVEGGPPQLFGFYLRRNGKHCDYIAVYTLNRVVTAFRPNVEIAELCFADPAAPPEGTSLGATRRLAEFAGGAVKSEQW